MKRSYHVAAIGPDHEPTIVHTANTRWLAQAVASALGLVVICAIIEWTE